MRKLLGIAIAGILIVACNGLGAFADEQEKDAKGKDQKPSAVEPPKREYSHVTQTMKECKFVLDGEKGTADYYYNGKRRQEGLVFARYAVLKSPSGERAGWVYLAENPEKKEQKMWFFFAKDPIKGPEGVVDYPMFYTSQPPDQNGKQSWTGIPLRTKVVDREKDTPKLDLGE